MSLGPKKGFKTEKTKQKGEKQDGVNKLKTFPSKIFKKVTSYNYKKLFSGKYAKKSFNFMKESTKDLKWADPRKSVSIRLFLIFFVAIMFFVLSIGIISYQMAKSTVEDNAEKANLATVTQTAQKLDIIFEKFQDNIQQMFLDDEMQKAIMDLALTTSTEYDKFTATTKMRTRLNALTFSTKGISGIYLVADDPNFTNVTSGAVDQNFLDTIHDQSWFKELSKSSKIVWLNVPEAKGTPVFRLARSVQSVNTMKRFVLVADLNLDILKGYIQELQMGEGAKVQILAPDNVIVASSVKGEEGKLSEFDISKAIEQKLESTKTKNAKGESVLAVFKEQATSGWKLLGSIPTAELTKDAKGILLTTYISAGVVAIIAILIGMWMVNMIGRPLVKLKDLMEEGAKGNLNVRMQVTSKDEIGQLTGSFNVMMEQITTLVEQTNHSAQDVLETATELTDASNKTAMSAKEIAIATEEIANGATSLANEAERGNELADNIGRQMEKVIQANKEMSTSAHEVEQSSQLGTKYLDGLLNKTNTTVDIIQALTDKVNTLKTSTSSVMKVLDVMQNITQQTNILSLNATIEAARAGAAGRGFMVVADEIRQLADQSRESIKMVGKITDEISTEMNQTVQALMDANPLFEEQIESVKETSKIFVSVQEKMEGFVSHLSMVTTSIDELNQSQAVMSEAMTNVSAVAEESSATSEEVASLSNEQENIGNHLVNLSQKLEQVSVGLKETLSKFTV